ncbi:MAG: hypothetical protein ABF293_06825 [Flavobacteriaceae bacterium]
MKLNVGKIVFLTLACIGLTMAHAQEEESAELYLEEYTDEFQERFFEALKQKGIENYDKAVNLLLECKQMEPGISTIDHELAKVYLNQKEWVSALEYSIDALKSQPENYWYASTFTEALQPQGRTSTDLIARIPFQNESLKQNLALIYYGRRNYKEALKILKEMGISTFTKDLTAKIRDSIDMASKKMAKPPPVVESVEKEDPLEDYKEQFDALLAAEDYTALEAAVAEALELFPSQPYFYLMMGKTLSLKNNKKEAVKVLEASLDFLLDDSALADEIYKELADAYRAMGNANKANMYLSKIKNGS